MNNVYFGVFVSSPLMHKWFHDNRTTSLCQGKLQSCHLILVPLNQNNLTTKDFVIISYFYSLDVLEHLQILSFYKSPLNLSHLYSAFMARPMISFRICNKKVWLVTKEKDMCLTRSIIILLQKSVQKQPPGHWSFTTV